MRGVMLAGLLAVGWASSSSASGAQALPQVASEGPAVQYGAMQYVLRSEAMGRDFLVKVTPPLLPVPAGRKLPVIYALDGGYELAGPVGWQLGASGGMSPAFIVSLGNVPKDFPLRDGDLNFQPYSENGRATPARGPTFARFLRDEVQPFVAARYAAVDPAQSYLFGHSLGGVFAAEMLAQAPGSFRGYIIASPAVRRDPGLNGRVSAAAASTGARGVRVFVAVGGAEGPAALEDARTLAAALSGPGSGLVVENRTYEGASHLSYYPRLVVDAFPWLLPPPH